MWALCFHGKNLLVSGSHDHTIKVSVLSVTSMNLATDNSHDLVHQIWNLESGQCERTLLAHQGPVWSVRCQKDVLVSASQDYSVRDAQCGRQGTHE